MDTRGKFLLYGTIVCAALSFSMVACTQIMQNTEMTYVDMSELEFVQENGPQDGDTVATIKTTLGDIKAVLYPEYAPNEVENFISLAESGYYDGTYVYQSEPGVYCSMGAADKEGNLPTDYDEKNETVEQEINQNLWTFKGALYAVSNGTEEGFWKNITKQAKTYNGSRFVVVNSVDFTDDFKEELLDVDDDTTVADEYIKMGGIPNLAQQVTVFGQTYEGFDVIDALTSVATEETDDVNVPVDDIFIESVEISTYDSGSVESTSEFETVTTTENVTE